MKVHLMFADQDFDPRLVPTRRRRCPDGRPCLAQLLDAMADGDPFLLQMCHAAFFQDLATTSAIEYRQRILTDVFAHEGVIRRLYDLAGEGVDADRHIHMGSFQERPGPKLRSARDCLEAFVKVLRELRQLIDDHSQKFGSPGLKGLCESLTVALADDYLDEVDTCLRILEFHGGSLQSVRLGDTNRGTDYMLRRPSRPPSWLGRFFLPLAWSRHTVTVDNRDIAGLQALSGLADHGAGVAADVLAQSSDHVLSFFRSLRRELAFYLGCANLHAALVAAGQPTCLPAPVDTREPVLTAHGLVDPLLAVAGSGTPVGNDVEADGSSLVVLTGANQGGKSTLLRALGLAQMMMQCGMYVVAADFRANLVDGVHTHFKREEDETMASGKFDEELDRMSGIVDRLDPGALVMCNESFATTNEREAAEVGGDIVKGLLDAGAKVYLVTHLYEFAHRLDVGVPDACFLRAARLDDGTRTFRLLPGEPLRTSYGEDLYDRVFDAGAVHAAPTAPLAEPTCRARPARG